MAIAPSFRHLLSTLKFVESHFRVHDKILPLTLLKRRRRGEQTEGYMAKVSDLLGSRSDIYSLREDMTAHDAARYLRERRVRAMAVCDNGGGILGVISQSDLSDKVAAENLHPDSVRVTEIMGKELIKVTTETSRLLAQRVPVQ